MKGMITLIILAKKISMKHQVVGVTAFFL